MSEHTLSPDQVQAIDAVVDWWDNGATMHFTLAGYAGTGKTTVISRMLSEFKDRVIVGASTGKAAHRLREKGVRAQTVHSLAYKFTGYDKNNDPEFDFTGRPSNSLVIIDEASMISQRMFDDLMEGGYRILFVGDHGQLPPIGPDPGLMSNPDFVLSVIHRQDDDGLLAFASDLRNGVGTPESQGAAHAVWIDPGDYLVITRKHVSESDVTICWKNSTRHWLNHIAMEDADVIKDIEYDPAFADDVLDQLRGKIVPVVCLRNNAKLRIFNGQIFDALIGSMKRDTVDLLLKMPNGDKQLVQAEKQAFRARSKLTQPVTPFNTFFDFGYAITAHRSQGSEWNKVCVFDDTNRNMKDRARWAYTAATRAKEELVWLHR